MTNLFQPFQISEAAPEDVATTLAERWADYRPPMPVADVVGDKWLLSSALQKLIRRGQISSAIAAALSLHRLDPAYLARRLPIIAIEDVGIGDLRVCFDVLSLCSSVRWWRADAARTIGFAVAHLANAVKCRTACDALCLGEAAASLDDRCAAPLESSREELIDVAVDRAASLVARINALRALGGISVKEGRYFKTVRACDARALDDVGRELSVPPLARWIMQRQARTGGLAAQLPIALAAAESATVVCGPRQLQSIAQLGGLPMCSVDQFSSVGKQVLAAFYGQSARLREFGARNIHPRREVAVFSMALFHVESGILNQRLASPALDELTADTEALELRQRGLHSAADREELYAILRHEMPRLHEMRRAALNARYCPAEASAGMAQ